MEIAQGSLAIVSANTDKPKVYWNGLLIENVKRIHIHNDEDESRVKLVVSGSQDQAYAEMIVAGITVKKVAV